MSFIILTADAQNGKEAIQDLDDENDTDDSDIEAETRDDDDDDEDFENSLKQFKNRRSSK